MTRRQARLAFGAIVVLLAALDFAQRIYVPREDHTRDASSFVPAQVPAQAGVVEIQKELAGWLPGLKPVAVETETPADGSWALALLGVFESRDGGFAVVRATPRAGGSPRVEQLVVGQEVFGLKVVSIEPRRVVLAGEGGEQSLELFSAKAGQAVGFGTARTGAAVPAAAAPGGPQPQRAATAKAATSQDGDSKSVTAKELQAGESIPLPGNMPVVEAQYKPPAAGAKQKRRPPPPPADPVNP